MSGAVFGKDPRMQRRSSASPARRRASPGFLARNYHQPTPICTNFSSRYVSLPPQVRLQRRRWSWCQTAQTARGTRWSHPAAQFGHGSGPRGAAAVGIQTSLSSQSNWPVDNAPVSVLSFNESSSSVILYSLSGSGNIRSSVKGSVMFVRNHGRLPILSLEFGNISSKIDIERFLNLNFACWYKIGWYFQCGWCSEYILWTESENKTGWMN